jgi:predicted nucleic acid-binding protein
MILAETTVWIGHLRSHDPKLSSLLRIGGIAMHPFVAAEVALGSLRSRQQTLAELDLLIQVRVARAGEVRLPIETDTLYSKGIGLTDAHLVALCLITPGTKLWTRDICLKRVTQILGIDAKLG